MNNMQRKDVREKYRKAMPARKDFGDHLKSLNVIV